MTFRLSLTWNDWAGSSSSCWRRIDSWSRRPQNAAVNPYNWGLTKQTPVYKYYDLLASIFIVVLLISNLVGQKICAFGPFRVSGHVPIIRPGRILVLDEVVPHVPFPNDFASGPA